MSNIKARALMGASALVMAMGAAATADAQNTSPATQPATAAVTIYGGGSTLVQPYIRQAEDCFGVKTPTWDKSTPPVAINEPSYNFTGATVPTNCATTQADPLVTIQYQGVGSGGGILGVFTHDPHNFASVGNYTPSGATAGAYWPTVNYGAADLPLGQNDVLVYDNGGTNIPTPNKNTNIAGSNNPNGTIANPLTNYGPLVQYPLLIAPVALTYSPIYKKTLNADSTVTNYSFHLKTAKVNVAGVTNVVPTLKLDAATYCSIFNGYITDWNDAAIGALNAYTVTGGASFGPAGSVNAKKKGVYVGGVFYLNGATVSSVEDQADPTPAASFSVPIELVGRSDSSGTSGIFTRHLEYACSKYLPSGKTNKIVAGPTLPSAVIAGASNGGPGTGLYTVKNGSDALAAYLVFANPTTANPTVTQGRIGYLGPDYTNPFSATATGLYGAALKNNNDGVFYLPVPKTALAAFGSVAPPESDATTGAYVPDTTGTAPHRNQPWSWVEPMSKTSPLAQAGDNLPGAYPITGTSNVLAYTCYADGTAGSVNNVGVQLNQFLTWYNTNGVVIAKSPATPGILAARGFADLPAAWKNAVKQTFLAPTTVAGTSPATNSLKLWVSPKSDVVSTTVFTGSGANKKGKVLFTHNPTCDTVVGG